MVPRTVIRCKSTTRRETLEELISVEGTACVGLMLFLVAGTIAFSAMTSSSFIAVFTAAGQCTGALVGLSMSMGALLSVVPLWNRLKPILDQDVEQVGDRAPGRLSGHVAAVALRFSYDPEAPQVLDDVSLEAKPGEFIAITGPTGSGKSTVLRMLLTAAAGWSRCRTDRTR